MSDLKNEKPETPKTIISNLPPALCDKGLFCNWEYDWNEDRKTWDKVPYNPGNILHRARTNDPATFSSLEKAAQNQNKIPGVAVGIFGTIGAIDIDGCISSEGEISKGAAYIVAIMNSYTEKTPSGTGLRVLFTVPENFKYNADLYKTEKHKEGVKHTGLEVYLPGTTHRFLTLTGHYVGERKDLEERPEQVLTVLDKYMKKPEPPKVERKEPAAPLCLSDQEIIDRIQHSDQAAKFAELWAGNWAGYPSQSEADAALCSMLAFWTQCDPGQMERIFSESELANRNKWNARPDYRQKTIEKAISACSVVYDPGFYDGEKGDGLTEADREGIRKMKERHDQQTEAIESPNLNETNASGQNTVEPPKIEIRANDGLTDAKEADATPDAVTDQGEGEPEEEKEKKEKEPAPIFRPYFIGDYISGGQFGKDLEYFQKYKGRGTGFSNIDRFLTLYPSLMTLGGCNSIGKSTFALNVADNLVRQGEDVIFFSMEQQAVELVTKSIARRLIEKDPKTNLTNKEIKDGYTSAALEAVKREYAEETGDHLIIVRCDFTVTAQQISDYVEAYIEETDRRPVVIIDYLQLIAKPSDPKFRGDSRAIVDENIKTIKRMQLNNELFVLMISNLNRSSYQTPASCEDFKESGLIEYTSDILAEMQPSIMETPQYFRNEYTNKDGDLKTKPTTQEQKNKMVDEALSMKKDSFSEGWTHYLPIDCEVVFLKNRNGRQKFKTFFKYDRQFDRFTEDDAAAWIDEDQNGGPVDSVAGTSGAGSADKYRMPWD